MTYHTFVAKTETNSVEEILTTHFAYPDSEPVKIHIRKAKTRIFITDGGYTISYLRSQLVDIEGDGFQDAMRMIATDHFCELDSEERFCCIVETARMSSADDIQFALNLGVSSLIQTAIEVCTLHNNEFSDD